MSHFPANYDSFSWEMLFRRSGFQMCSLILGGCRSWACLVSRAWMFTYTVTSTWVEAKCFHWCFQFQMNTTGFVLDFSHSLLVLLFSSSGKPASHYCTNLLHSLERRPSSCPLRWLLYLGASSQGVSLLWAALLPHPVPFLCVLWQLPGCPPLTLIQSSSIVPQTFLQPFNLKIQDPLKLQSRFMSCIWLFCLFNQKALPQCNIGFFFLNSFIEIQFLYHTIHPDKV